MIQPFWAPDNRLKHFEVIFLFHQDIYNFFQKLWGVHHTEESESTVSIKQRSQTPRCASYILLSLTPQSESDSGIRFHSVHPTLQSSSTLCIIPTRAKLHSVHHTAQTDSTVCIIPRRLAPRCASDWCQQLTKFLF